MKRRDVVAHLLLHGCQLMCEGARHSLWENPFNKRISTLPRHREINDYLVKKICKDLEIRMPVTLNGHQG